MLRIAIIWLVLAVLLSVMIGGWWDLRRFVARHPVLTRERGIAALATLVRRQMRLSVGMLALGVLLLVASFVLPGGGFGLHWPVLGLGSMLILPFLLRAQRSARTLPCENDVVRAERDAMVAIWFGSFWPPRDVAVAIADTTAPAAALAPPLARGAGLATVALVLMFYFQRIELGAAANALPLGFLLGTLGISVAIWIVALGLLLRKGSLLGALALLTTYLIDRVGWIVAGGSPAALWVAFTIFLLGWYLGAAVSIAKSRRAGAAPSSCG